MRTALASVLAAASQVRHATVHFVKNGFPAMLCRAKACLCIYDSQPRLESDLSAEVHCVLHML